MCLFRCSQPVSMQGELDLMGRPLPLALASQGGAASGGGSEQRSPACQLQHAQHVLECAQLPDAQQACVAKLGAGAAATAAMTGSSSESLPGSAGPRCTSSSIQQTTGVRAAPALWRGTCVALLRLEPRPRLAAGCIMCLAPYCTRHPRPVLRSGRLCLAQMARQALCPQRLGRLATRATAWQTSLRPIRKTTCICWTPRPWRCCWRTATTRAEGELPAPLQNKTDGGRRNANGL